MYYSQGPGLWKQIPCTMPARFKGEVPLFQVIKGYCLDIKQECLKIERTFSQCKEETRVTYIGPELNEMVYISDGLIKSVNSHYNTSKGIYNEKDNEENFMEKIQELFNPPKTKTPQYHNIKRFGQYFELLVNENPEWKKDLDAILLGSGEFSHQNI